MANAVAAPLCAAASDDDPYLQELIRGSVPSSSRARVAPLSDDEIGWFCCAICAETRLVLDRFRAGSDAWCAHDFCIACVVRYIEGRVADGAVPVPCPAGAECPGGGVLHPEACKNLLDMDVFDAWCVALAERAVGPARARCPYGDCGELLWLEAAPTCPRASCPTCSRAFCLQCDEPWDERHGSGGRGGCVVARLASWNKWTRCPSCRAVIEKMEGCRRMVCRCGTSFCYVCGSAVSENRCRCSFRQEDPCSFRQEDPASLRAFTATLPIPLPISNMGSGGHYRRQPIIPNKFMGPARARCPYRDCGELVSLEAADGATSEVDCPTCSRAFCLQCEEPWDERHGGDGDGRGGCVLARLADRNNWKRCPRCRAMIEKIEGCSRMVCRCGTSFCYLCGSVTEKHCMCVFRQEDALPIPLPISNMGSGGPSSRLPMTPNIFTGYPDPPPLYPYRLGQGWLPEHQPDSSSLPRSFPSAALLRRSPDLGRRGPDQDCRSSFSASFVGVPRMAIEEKPLRWEQEQKNRVLAMRAKIAASKLAEFSPWQF